MVDWSLGVAGPAAASGYADRRCCAAAIIFLAFTPIACSSTAAPPDGWVWCSPAYIELQFQFPGGDVQTQCLPLDEPREIENYYYTDSTGGCSMARTTAAARTLNGAIIVGVLSDHEAFANAGPVALTVNLYDESQCLCAYGSFGIFPANCSFNVVTPGHGGDIVEAQLAAPCSLPQSGRVVSDVGPPSVVLLSMTIHGRINSIHPYDASAGCP